MEYKKRMIHTPGQHIPVIAVVETNDGISLEVKSGRKIESTAPDWLIAAIYNNAAETNKVET